MSITHRMARARVLARVALGLSTVQDAMRFFGAGAVAAAAGLAAAWLTRTAAIGVFAAALAGAAASVTSVRRLRREQAVEFARAARRLGQEKTALAELRSACRRLGSAVDRSLSEAVIEDDTRDTWSGGPALFDPSPPPRDRHLAKRLKRIARAAGFFGGTDIELKRLALAGPCAEVIEQYRRVAGPEQEILYAEDGGGDWLAAPLDRPLFVLAIREILDNVFEHGGDWNRITVTTEPVTGAILLRIRDDGAGLDPEAMTDVSSGRTTAGGGLGLFVARAIVEAHGGQFKVESHPGQGTSVSLKFPTHS